MTGRTANLVIRAGKKPAKPVKPVGLTCLDIVPAWMWRSPEEIIEGLLALSARTERRGEQLSVHTPARIPRDRYYTMARRHRIRNLMRGKT